MIRYDNIRPVPVEDQARVCANAIYVLSQVNGRRQVNRDDIHREAAAKATNEVGGRWHYPTRWEKAYSVWFEHLLAKHGFVFSKEPPR